MTHALLNRVNVSRSLIAVRWPSLPNTAVELVSIAPLLQVHGAGDRGPVVGDEGLQGAVHEQVVVLNTKEQELVIRRHRNSIF